MSNDRGKQASNSGSLRNRVKNSGHASLVKFLPRAESNGSGSGNTDSTGKSATSIVVDVSSVLVAAAVVVGTADVVDGLSVELCDAVVDRSGPVEVEPVAEKSREVDDNDDACWRRRSRIRRSSGRSISSKSREDDTAGSCTGVVLGSKAFKDCNGAHSAVPA